MANANRRAREIVRGRWRRTQARAYVEKYLDDHPCIRCGENDNRVKTFHHRDPSQKEAKVSSMIGKGFSIPMIAREIAKCDVLCSNCHLILHAEEREEERNGMGHGVQRARARRA